MTAKCKSGWPMFISASGHLYPCCFITNSNPRNEEDFFFKNKEKLDLKSRPMKDILQDSLWEELSELWQTEDAPEKCKAHCGMGRRCP